MENRCVAVPVCYGLSGGIDDRGHLPCEIVEGHRYAADDEPSWYEGKGLGQYARSTDPGVYDSGIHERPSGAFRLPEQRPAVAPPSNPYALTDPLATTGSHSVPPEETRIPVRGPEYPTIRPTLTPTPTPMPEPQAVPAPVAEPTALVPPIPAPKENVYHSRRPVTSFLVAVVMIVLMIPVVRLLIDQTFTGDPTPRGIVPAVLLTLGFTLTGIGLFAIARGGTITRESWLRPPVAYLPAGLILLVAAGLATS